MSEIGFSEIKSEDPTVTVFAVPTNSSTGVLQTPPTGVLSPVSSPTLPSDSPQSSSTPPLGQLQQQQQPPQGLQQHLPGPGEPMSDTVIELFNGEESLINLFMRKTREKRVVVDEISPLSPSSSAAVSSPRFFNSNFVELNALIFSCSKYERIPNCPIVKSKATKKKRLEPTLSSLTHYLRSFIHPSNLMRKKKIIHDVLIIKVL